ncbi:MAG: 4Fe-4S dicluster domain-containing protein [Bacteroidota bacterium]|nr:4Fe-4S dicluster domain-containing protein [Bacteroidota bacterium]
MKEEENTSRRAFLEKSLVGGISALGVASLFSACDTDVKETGEKVKLLSPDGQIVEVDSAYINTNIPDLKLSEHNIREGVAGKKFVMVIDLSRCKNAKKCKEGCSKMHFLPKERSYVKVEKMQDSEKTAPYWMPMTCFHCDNPPCTKVCPVDATFKLSDGIVAIDNDRCIGCRFCMVACPYSARIFNWGEEMYALDKEEEKAIPEHTACSTHKLGTVEKCDFCPQKGEKNELPDCVSACPNGVFYFGNEYDDAVTNGDETLQLSELLKTKAAFRYLEELGTKPRVYYLPPVNRLFPFKDVEESKNS